MGAVTHTLTAGQAGIRGESHDYPFPWRRPQAVVDADSANTNGYNIANTDIVQMIDVRAEEVVLLVVLEVVTSEGGAATVTVGDGADPDGFIATADVNVTAGTTYSSVQTYTVDLTNADLELPDTLAAGILGLVGGKYYSAADTIDIVAAAALDAAALRLTALIANMGGAQTTGNLRTATA